MERSILIVDDEPDMLHLLQRSLAPDLKCRIETAASAREALAVLMQDSFDLVLADIKMPEMDGLQLLEQIKRHDPDLTVVMMTAFGQIDTAVTAMKTFRKARRCATTATMLDASSIPVPVSATTAMDRVKLTCSVSHGWTVPCLITMETSPSRIAITVTTFQPIVISVILALRGVRHPLDRVGLTDVKITIMIRKAILRSVINAIL